MCILLIGKGLFGLKWINISIKNGSRQLATYRLLLRKVFRDTNNLITDIYEAIEKFEKNIVVS